MKIGLNRLPMKTPTNVIHTNERKTTGDQRVMREGGGGGGGDECSDDYFLMEGSFLDVPLINESSLSYGGASALTLFALDLLAFPP